MPLHGWQWNSSHCTGLAHYPRLPGGTGAKLWELLKWGFFRELLEPPRGEALGTHYVLPVLQGASWLWICCSGMQGLLCLLQELKDWGPQEVEGFGVGKVKSRKRGDSSVLRTWAKIVQVRSFESSHCGDKDVSLGVMEGAVPWRKSRRNKGRQQIDTFNL